MSDQRPVVEVIDKTMVALLQKQAPEERLLIAAEM
ncbi:hypothetical protein Mal35_47250 [Gimesia maris]|uniref:Uncharacterized protein n=1 Tax=Gimesia algae TaxID=2527971 RepID=A0A517VJT6_9PLAN|nr:hypothetical protein Mal35_47250 [Gimesia maris]QDT93262.1 hypothetical protein Pan161_49400 [Gimesia algae]